MMRTLFIIPIFMWLFHLYEASILIRYRGIADDFAKWKNEPNAPEDKIPGYTNTKRKEICARLWYPNKYIYLERDPVTSEIPDDLILYKNIQLIKKIQEYKMSIEYPIKDTINVFLCARDNNRDYYVTFAFRNEYHYVILSVPKDSDVTNTSTYTVKFYALIQSDGRIDDNLVVNKPKYFAHSFWGHSFFEGFNERSVVQLPSEMDLCDITEYQHFGVCSAVANKVRAKLSEDYGIDLDIQKFNTIREIQERCVTRVIVDEESKLKTAPSNVLPCVINKKEPQFYLMRSPLDEPIPSVFVLVRSKANDSENNVLELATKVDHVYNIV